MSAFTWIRKVQILVLVLGVCTSSVVQAGINQWTKKGDPGSDITELVIDPQTPTILYAVYGSQSQKSIDGGESWVPLALPSNTAIGSLVVDPRNPTILYAGYHQYGPGT